MKKFITIVLTAILFVAAVVLGVNSVYRVSEVALEINYVSEEAKLEAELLEERLSAVYGKRSIFEVKANDSESVFAEFSYFRLTDFKKEYPNKIVVEATEDDEVFAVASEVADEYYILALDGTILSIRENALNRSDNAPNILIDGVHISGEKGEICTSEEIVKLLPFLQELSTCMDGLRANITKIEYVIYGGNVEQYNFSMREGVTLMLQKADEMAKEKANKVAEKYASLEDKELLSGYLYATNSDEKATVVYSPTEITLN